MIKISILKDGDKFAFMECQSGNDPKVYNNIYGTTGFYDLEEALKSIFETYKGETITLIDNINQPKC
jgi:hypothetical protein